MRRREFITLIGGAAVPWPLAAHAQQPAMPVVGFLHSTSRRQTAKRLEAFLKGLERAGFVDGQNVTISYRWAEGQNDKLPALAADLVHQKVAIITTPGSIAAALAAKAATSAIPIVFATGADPVAVGLVASLNRPGGNVTGVTSLNINIATKRLELLHQLVPQATRYFVLIDPGSPVSGSFIKDVEAAAPKIGLHVDILRAGNASEIDTAFTALQRGDALLSSTDPFLYSRRDQIIALSSRYAVPTAFDTPDYVEAGGLLSYGADFLDVLQRAGRYVGRILKGEKPADLPVEQSEKFELAINLKTAKALGINVPPNLLALADEVIE
jgi:putative tryptophan/tyrosine transport system substrate-binding protein